jgi:phosphatidylserine/phosphatidylglycerophosphate/cardiolipin synthase-like enzyme
MFVSSSRFVPANALPWLIPQILLTAQREAAIVSPWIENVPLKLPPGFGSTLSDLLANLEKRLSITLVLREQDNRARTVLQQLQNIRVQTRSTLHTKAIVTERLLLITTANLLPTSLYRNEEAAQLSGNPYPSIAEALKAIATR